MRLMRLEPIDEMRRVRREVDRLLEDILTGYPARELTVPMAEWEPPIEMFESEHEIVVRAALPNIDPKQVEITVTNDTITLRGETKSEEENKDRNYYRRELQYGSFLRVLPLPAGVKGAEAKAAYKDGVLEVKIPKSERAKATSVKVTVE